MTFALHKKRHCSFAQPLMLKEDAGVLSGLVSE
jgi:hypothetical protein